jgi:hypothetical protein
MLDALEPGRQELRVFQVLVGGCALPVVLLLGIITPFTVRKEYRRYQGYWPQAKWLALLEVCAREGVTLLMALAFVAALNYKVGVPPLVSYGAGSELSDILVAVIGGLTLLAGFGWAGVFIVQARRYGLPPRNRPA